MIRYTTGDILAAQTEAIVNPVNCVGVMGKGLALAFKQRFLNNEKLYRIECEFGRMVPGRVFVTWVLEDSPPWYIVNFPTKDHWRDPSRIEWIRDGLTHLVQVIPLWQIRSIAIPALGCGLGGLRWPDVRREIEGALGGEEMAGVEVVVYGPNGEG